MNVKSVEKEKGAAKLVLEVEKARFDAAVDAAYRKNRKDIFVPGFRKGKAPRKVIEGMYGATVFYEEAINDMFPEIYAEAIASEQLKVVGSPSIENVNFEEDGSLTLTVTQDLYPEVTLGQYKGLEVPKAEATVGEDEIDAEIDRLVERNARISTVERPLANGDTAVMDFEGFVDGKPFEGGKAEKYSLKIGSGSFIPGFEDQLVGLSAGEEKDVEVTFPEDYGAKELAGKPAVFHCKIHEVKETILPAKDDEFVKDVSECNTMAELREDIRKRFTERKQADIDAAFENACVEAAAANMTCEIPASMIDDMAARLVEQYGYQLQMSGMKLEDYARMMGTDVNGMRNIMRPNAEVRVKNDLCLAKIIEEEKIELTDEEIENEYKTLAENYQMDVEKVKGLVSAEDIRADKLYSRAAKLIVEAAVPTKPAPAEAEEEKKPAAKKPRKTAAKKAEEAGEGAEEEKKPAAKKPRKTAAKKTEDAAEEKTDETAE